jgi:hypothetical protein
VPKGDGLDQLRSIINRPFTEARKRKKKEHAMPVTAIQVSIRFTWKEAETAGFGCIEAARLPGLNKTEQGYLLRAARQIGRALSGPVSGRHRIDLDAEAFQDKLGLK